MAEVGSAWVSVAPSAKGFGRDLEHQVSGEVTKSGKGIGAKFGGAMKLGIAGAAAGGVLALGAFLKGSLEEAREAQKVGALTASTIKATGGAANVTAEQIGNLSTAISNKTGIDDEAIQSGANMLLTFKNLRNETGKGNDIFSQATTTLTDMGAALGKDPRSSAIQLGKALNDPVKGVAALSRVGVTFNEQQKDTIKSMVETGDTLGAQKMILKELNSEFGGAAEAQATAGEKAAVAWGNFKETIGTALLPVVDKVLGVFTTLVLLLTDQVGPAFSKVADFMAPVGDNVGSNLLPIIGQLAALFTTTLLPALMSVAQYVATNVAPIFAQVWTIISTQLLPILRGLAQFFIGSVLPALVRIYTAIAVALKPAFDALFKAIRETLLPAVSQLLAKFKEWQPTLQAVIMVLLKVIGFILRLAAVILGKVLPVAIKLAAFLIRVLVAAIILVVGTLVKIIAVLIKVGTAFVNGGKKVGEFAGKVKDGVDKAIKWVNELPERIRKAVGDLAGLLYEQGKKLIQGLIDGIEAKAKDLTAKMSQLAGKVKKFLPGSPVKEGPLKAWNRKSPGSTLVERIAEGLSDSSPVDAAMTRLARRVQLTARTGGGAAAAAATGLAPGARLRLVVDGREFNAYVDSRADGRVSSARDLAAEKGRARW